MRERAASWRIVLHTHMPYVEGFGTWPFGEEWLWEAIATCYLPLLDVLDARRAPPVTLSLTPVLCDQLEAPGAIERCLELPARGSAGIAPRSTSSSCGGRGGREPRRELERSAASMRRAAERLAQLPGGLLAELGAARELDISATHAVLPLLATDSAAAMQIADRDRLAPAPLRRLGGRLLAAGVRARSVARRAASRRPESAPPASS